MALPRGGIGAVVLAIRDTQRAPTDFVGSLTAGAIRSAYVRRDMGAPPIGGDEWHEVHAVVSRAVMFAGRPQPPLDPASLPDADPLLPLLDPPLVPLELPLTPLLLAEDPEEPELLAIPELLPPFDNPPLLLPLSSPDNASPE